MDTLLNNISLSNYIFRQSFDSIAFQVNSLKPGMYVKIKLKDQKLVLEGLCIKKNKKNITILQTINKYSCLRSINLTSKNIDNITVINKNNIKKFKANSKFLDIKSLIKTF